MSFNLSLESEFDFGCEVMLPDYDWDEIDWFINNSDDEISLDFCIEDNSIFSELDLVNIGGSLGSLFKSV